LRVPVTVRSGFDRALAAGVENFLTELLDAPDAAMAAPTTTIDDLLRCGIIPSLLA
jgi:hypothetical protein